MKRTSRTLGFGAMGLSLFVAAQSWAAPPACLKGTTPLAIDNARVLLFKTTTPAQYHDRARVQGRVVKLFPDQTGHDHFLIQIGPKSTDTLEVVYSNEFGDLPGPNLAQDVEACGDYITTQASSPNAKVGNVGGSNTSAIIHWVHASDSAQHENGYVTVDNIVYGQTIPPGGHH